MNLNRRQFLFAASAPALAAVKGATPPNVVLIVAEDIGAWMLGCYGNRDLRTPAIDLLARGGTRFLLTAGGGPAPAAARATLFSGRVPGQHSVLDAAGQLPAGEVLISDLLAAAGYSCGYAGAWKLGKDQQPQHGFKFWSTSENDATAKALEFLEGRKGPFFLTVNLTPPAAPEEKFTKLYSDVKFENIGFEDPAANARDGKERLGNMVESLRKQAAAVSALDDQVAQIAAALDRMQLRTNTLIVFTSTNGFLLGRHGLWSGANASDPNNMFEEVTNVPVIWNWQGKLPVEGVRPELVAGYDLLPTLCELTGTTAPARNLPGRSYVPALRNEPFPKKQPWRTTAFAQLRDTEMMRGLRYKLVLRNQGKGQNELYDMRVDSREKANQYDNPRFVTLRDQMYADLVAWRKKFAQ